MRLEKVRKPSPVDYKKLIIDIIDRIDNERILKMIYGFAKASLDF